MDKKNIYIQFQLDDITIKPLNHGDKTMKTISIKNTNEIEKILSIREDETIAYHENVNNQKIIYYNIINSKNEKLLKDILILEDKLQHTNQFYLNIIIILSILNCCLLFIKH